MRNRGLQRERSLGNQSREASPSFFDKLIDKVKDEFLKDGPSKERLLDRSRGGIPRNKTFTMPVEQVSPLKRLSKRVTFDHPADRFDKRNY